jgi:hypothetical protein
MKKIAILLAVGVSVALLLIVGNPSKESIVDRRNPGTGSTPTMEQRARATELAREFVADTGTASGLVATGAVPMTSQEVASNMMQQFARVARLYQFDPVVTNYSRETRGPRRVEIVAASTATHVAQIRNGRLFKIQAMGEGSDTRWKPSATKEWYAGPRNWSDKEAIAETMRILQAVSITGETLAAVREGKPEVTPIETPIRHPDGTETITTPFVSVALKNKKGDVLVRAEHRLSAEGSAGVTVWFQLGQ